MISWKIRIWAREVDPYAHFNIKPIQNDIKVIVGEPDIMNPNSFKNIKQIVQNIATRANRQWVFLENDGGILGPLLKLIFNTYRCKV